MHVKVSKSIREKSRRSRKDYASTAKSPAISRQTVKRRRQRILSSEETSA
jgi:hypothetical protein